MLGRRCQTLTDLHCPYGRRYPGPFVSPNHLISTFGTIGIIAIVFAETGLLVGFFLPGDSLLIAAGLFSATHRVGYPHLNLAVLLVGCAIAAVAGDQIGYLIGQRAGPALYSRPNSRFFRQEHVQKAHDYFERRGPVTVVLARFAPILRTFVPVIAGVSRMPYRLYATFNVFGGVLWSCGVLLLGYGVGKSLGQHTVDKFILPIEAVVIVISLVPVGIELLRHRRARDSQTATGA